jgi:hypothetical protein
MFIFKNLPVTIQMEKEKKEGNGETDETKETKNHPSSFT